MSLDIAIAASARDWPDRLHRYVLDHGGARIVGRLLGPAQCVDSAFDVILIDDVCSFLTPRLVTLLRQEDKAVVGVFDAADSPDAKRRLLECGISDVIESDASAHEFLARAGGSVVSSRPLLSRQVDRAPTGRSIGVVGVSDGVGTTEVSIALAATASKMANTVLLDLDPAWPSVAQRLDISPYPNLRSLIDVTLHHGEVDQAIQDVLSLRVVAGAVSDPSPSPIPGHEVAMALHAIAERYPLVVADLGAEERVNRHLLRSFDAVVLVSGPDPVGLARLFKSRDRIVADTDEDQILVVVNKVPGRRFYKSEIRAEVGPVLRGGSLLLLPFDEGIVDASWGGTLVNRGRFAKEFKRVARLVTGVVLG
jgi:MinD-like ATPase involved in chromosome partitioning or flagellar assembly